MRTETATRNKIANNILILKFAEELCKWRLNRQQNV